MKVVFRKKCFVNNRLYEPGEIAEVQEAFPEVADVIGEEKPVEKPAEKPVKKAEPKAETKTKSKPKAKK